MSSNERKRQIEEAADGWDRQNWDLRNAWIRGLAASRGKTEKEFLRMVVDADIEAAASGNLPTSRKETEAAYEEWFDFLDNFDHK